MNAWIEADWPAPRGVRALVTTRSGMGVSRPPFDAFDLGLRNGGDLAAVAENRQLLEAALRLPSAPRWLRQVHGTTVAIEPGEDEPEADAAVTSAPGTVLAILTADCLPVAFAAKDGSEVAVAHAGWRGLVAGVLEATVAAMRTPPSDVVAWFGPAAGPQAYEVGAEVFDAFALCDPRARTAFVPTRPGHWNVDLYALAKQRLADVGVGGAHGGGLCTISDPSRFFSHRRSASDGSGRTGRMATLAWIAPR
ncbi:MAG: peptidoglycan editing factor PgeF [Thermomonas sp.]